MTINQPALDALVAKLFGDLSAGYGGVMVSIGDKLGLYKAVAAAGPLSSEEVARRSGCAERYVREWLNSQVAGGYVMYHPGSETYELTAEQAQVLAEDTSPVFLPHAWQVVASMWADENKALDGFRTGKGVGLDPQPGLAQLRVGQGRSDAAATAVRRVVSTTMDRLKRMRLLPAYIEIMLAVGDVQDARNACRELEEIARSFDTGVPGAIAAQACGAVDLAEGDAQAALGSLRRAFEVWQRLKAPYAAAQVRVLIGLACRALGDEDGAGLELGAARSVFEQLGAAPDLVRLDSVMNRAPSDHSHRLTPRELQVLRLVAAGDTNKAIASKLSLSEKTVERHVSNIFAKLDLPSRAAATAFAYQRKLI